MAQGRPSAPLPVSSGQVAVEVQLRNCLKMSVGDVSVWDDIAVARHRPLESNSGTIVSPIAAFAWHCNPL